MSIINWRTLQKSFTYAGKGIKYAFRNEQSFRFQLVATLIVAILMFSFPLSAAERIVLILVVFMVLILELINTTFEKIIDILKPRVHFYAEVVKDLTAAVVLLASLGALIIGLYIFIPYIF